MKNLRDKIFERIKHGDKEHQDWLENELKSFFDEIEAENKSIKFWDTKEGKILSHAVHDHNSGLGRIVNNVYYLKELLKDKDYENPRILITLDSITSAKDDCRNAMDYAYNNIKDIITNK